MPAELKKLDHFFKKARLVHYKKRETIIRAGMDPQGVFYIKKGYARLYSLSENGQELTYLFYQPQDFFPMLWAINNTQNTFFLEALTPVELWRVPREEFLQLLKENPDILFAITTRLAIRIDRLLERIKFLTFGSAYQKVGSMLCILADRIGKKKGSKVVIPVPLTHKDIAVTIGLARETVSVEMKKLVDKHIILHENKILTILHMEKLINESSIKSFG